MLISEVITHSCLLIFLSLSSTTSGVNVIGSKALSGSPIMPFLQQTTFCQMHHSLSIVFTVGQVAESKFEQIYGQISRLQSGPFLMLDILATGSHRMVRHYIRNKQESYQWTSDESCRSLVVTAARHPVEPGTVACTQHTLWLAAHYGSTFCTAQHSVSVFAQRVFPRNTRPVIHLVGKVNWYLAEVA